MMGLYFASHDGRLWPADAAGGGTHLGHLAGRRHDLWVLPQRPFRVAQLVVVSGHDALITGLRVGQNSWSGLRDAVRQGTGLSAEVARGRLLSPSMAQFWRQPPWELRGHVTDGGIDLDGDIAHPGMGVFLQVVLGSSPFIAVINDETIPRQIGCAP